jgi:hypothetical protein
MKKRFSDEQIISILREAEAGVSARELCRYEAQRPAADTHLSGRITELALNWHWSAGVLVTAASGSYCAVRAFMLITSACTAFIILEGWA